MENRTLYFGDNLEVLREIPDETFDLIYLDPPFSSKRDYNILFKEGMVKNYAQTVAFKDSWHWTPEARDTFNELVGSREIPASVSKLMRGFKEIIGENDVMAYLVMMTIRLVELKRVLKDTGSIYLHCDPTASHYLKIVMDVVFGKKNFRNEIVWCYSEREISKKYWNKKHDTIFFYTKRADNKHTFNWKDVALSYSPGTIKKFNYEDKDGRKFQIRGKGSPYTGKQGLNIELEKTCPDLVYRDYLDKSPGVPPRDWLVIPVINRAAKERLGYPTQKPERLLERIILASSNEGDWILDPFCGCGTTVAVAERLNRKWVGIDITTLAINLIRNRLIDGDKDLSKKIILDGLPKDLQGARALAKKDPFQFEYWALDLVNAKPFGDKTKESMRGADRGIDGIYTFKDLNEKNEIIFKDIIVQVKGGKTSVRDIRDLRGVIERENVSGGILITLNKPTKPMVDEAIKAGTFTAHFNNQEFPKIQMITIEDLFEGKELNVPKYAGVKYYKEAQRVKKEDKGRQLNLNDIE